METAIEYFGKKMGKKSTKIGVFKLKYILHLITCGRKGVYNLG